MAEPLQTLKRCIREYKEVDDQIRDINKTVQEMREKRRKVEAEMAEIVKLPQFNQIEKLKIEDDGSLISIQRPNMWSKAWTLSKKDLVDFVNQYFMTTRSPNPSDCVQFVVEKKKTSLVANEYAFNRTVPNEIS
jgi:phage pi2 protein 07